MKLFVRKIGRQVSSGGRVAPHYYASPPKQSSTETTVRARRRFRPKGIKNWLFIIALLLILGWALSLNNQPNIKVDSTQYRSTQTYSDGVSKMLSGILSRSKVTLNQAKLTKSIQQQFPEVQLVKISLLPYSRTANISLKIAAPTFTLSGAPGTYGENVRYVIAANGKVVGLNVNLSQINSLPNLTDQSGSQIKTGELVLGQGTASFILAIIAQLQKNHIPIASFNLAKSSQEIDLRTMDKAYYVKFNLAADPTSQIGQYLAARESLAKTGEPSQYLDVRVDGRIFYK